MASRAIFICYSAYLSAKLISDKCCFFFFLFKDDFRSLFTAGERFKVEYRTLQEEYKNLKTETGRLKLGNTEMQGELNSRTDLLAGLQLENAKLQQKCEVG